MLFLSRLTIIIHRYFEENICQYSLGRRRLYVCVLRAGPGSGYSALVKRPGNLEMSREIWLSVHDLTALGWQARITLAD